MRTINRQFRQTAKQTSPEKAVEGTRPLTNSLSLLTSLLRQASHSLHQSEPLIPPAVGGLLSTSPAKAATGYVQFDEGRLFLITAQPVSDKLEKTAVRRLRALVKETQVIVPGVNVGITGKSVLELDEMQQSRKDHHQSHAHFLVVGRWWFLSSAIKKQAAQSKPPCAF